MAVYTPLPFEDADRIARAHGLGGALRIEGVRAGSVNSNFFVDTEVRRVFVRIYEEQEAPGVGYEWALLDHLTAAGIPVPRRVEGSAPGEIRVAGKPTAVFETIAGEEICQRMVDPERAWTVGALLARAHLAAADFPSRVGRYTRADIRERLAGVAALDRPELREAVGVLGEVLDELDALPRGALPRGVIHGDVFRDNVRWEDGTVIGLLDWESACTGSYVFDLAVTVLAWCYGDDFDPTLADALRAGYGSVRPLTDVEDAGFADALTDAAVRFTVTRITDYHLREGEQVKKDWRRFYARLSAVRQDRSR